MTDTLDKLYEIIQGRKGGDPKKSYIAKMFKKGPKKISQKVGEEATEVVIAYLAESDKEVVSETADLLFHLMVLLADKDIPPEQVMQELESRMGQSGLDEKAARKIKTD